MNIRTSAFRTLAVLSLSVLGMAACDEKDPIVPVVTPPVTVTVTPASVALTQGQTVTLVAVVANSTNQSVNWVSTNTAVATVSGAGVVTAVAPGVATITATSAADANAKAAAVVTVTAPAPTPVTITLLPAAAGVAIGGTVQLVPTVAGSTNTAVTYRTSAPAVATVSTAGVVTGVSAGTAIITAVAAADTTKKAMTTITVASNPIPTISITPQTASVGVGGTQQFVATVSGSANTGVTYRSSDPTVATISAAGLAAALKQGTTVITAIAAADTTVRATATLTVVGASVAISTVPASPAVGAFTIAANVSVPAGTADSLMITLTNTTTNAVYTMRCQTFTAAGAATTVNCPINPADLDPNTAGAQILPNGTYQIQAILIRQNQVAATATFGSQLTTANANTVAGVVTFDNATVDTDNQADANQDVGPGGVVWFGGSAKVDLTPSIFLGNAIASVQVFVDQNCNAAQDDPDGAGPLPTDPIRTVTIAAGTGTVTFPETANMAAASPGIDDLSAAGVCFGIVNPLDANGAAVTLGAAAGTGNVITIGSPINPIVGPGQNAFNIDNVPTVLGALTLPPSMTAVAPWPVLNWAGTATTFSQTGADAVGGVVGADAGVNAVAVTFYAVDPTLAFATQANLAAATTAAGSVALTKPSDLGSSSLSNAAWRLVSKSVDKLGNVVYGSVGTFGVDIDAPTAAAAAASMAANGSINTAADVVVNVTDVHSGSVQLRFRGTVHSVLELDADAGTELACVRDNVGTVTAMVAGDGGVCPWINVGLVNIGGTTEQGTANHPAIPLPAATTEGYYVYEAQGIDRAGNFSTAMGFTTLTDVSVPGATIGTASFDFVNKTVSLTGTINENVDLKSYDTRFNFPALGGGAGAGAGADVPDQIPFVVPTPVDSYGLPLTGVLAVSGANSVSVSDIRDASGTILSNQFGFFATDVAGNYAFTGQAITPTAGAGVMYDPDGSGPLANVVLPLAQFNAEFDTDATVAVNAQCLDRSGNGGAGCPASGNLYVEVTVDEEDLNPISTIYYYIVDAGADNLVATADDYNVLVATAAGSTATVTTGITERIFRFSTPVTVALHRELAAPNNVYRMFAIGVAANGSAIASDVVNLTIQP